MAHYSGSIFKMFFYETDPNQFEIGDHPHDDSIKRGTFFRTPCIVALHFSRTFFYSLCGFIFCYAGFT